jgi:Poly(R)-hydroxyalkanoic acid synthase subunit (PHA_synth_III_E)
MAQPSSLDPFALWRDLVSQMEKGVNEVADPALKSDEFAKIANKVLSASVAGKALKQEMMNRYFGALNLPTRSDIDALSDRLHAIEDRIIAMSATLDRLAGVQPRGAAVTAPSRTRKPPPAVPDAAVAAPPAAAARKRTKART